MILLKNDALTVKIKPYGAELSGISDNETGHEYLWQGEPSVWGGQAPILFPIAGRLLSDSFTYGDKKYYLQKHGFARKSAFEIVSAEEDHAVFSLSSSEDTHRVYPFDFTLTVDYRLENKNLTVRHTVKNETDGEMYFSIGAHPAFNITVGDSVKFSEYEDFSTLVFDEATIAVGEKPLYKNCNSVTITEHLFDNDALFFPDLKSTSAKLVTADGKEILQMTFDKSPFVGLWAKPNAPFVCIEPWQGISDTPNVSGKLEEKPYINRLAKGEEYTFTYSVEIL